MHRSTTGRLSIAAAAASLLTITMAVTIGFSTQVAAITTSQGWADSYSADGKCYCSSSFDHGVGAFEYQGESVREICRRLGDGPKAGRVYYNTIQCGHEPAHRDSIRIDGQQVQDEVVCPGRVGNGVPCNSEKGPMWDLGTSPTTPPPTTTPPTTTQPNPAPTPPNPAPTTAPPVTVAPTTAPTPGTGPCQATGATLTAARQAYAQACTAPRVDCDPIPSGYLCSSENIPSNPSPTPTPTPTPTTTPAPPITSAPTTAPPTTPAPPTTQAPGDGLVLDVLDASTDRSIGTLVGTEQAFTVAELPAGVAFDLLTVPDGTRSVVFQVRGALANRQVENYAPYASFGNSGQNFFGRSFGPGSYEVSVEIYAGRSGSGARLAAETLTFEVTG